MVLIPSQAKPLPDDTLTVLTEEEWREAAHRGLDRVGLTYEELEEQSRDGNFDSFEALKLWMLIGGTL